MNGFVGLMVPFNGLTILTLELGYDTGYDVEDRNTILLKFVLNSCKDKVLLLRHMKWKSMVQNKINDE